MIGDWTPLHKALHAVNPSSMIVAGSAGVGKSCAIRLGLGSRITYWLRCSGDPNLRDARERIKAIARRRVETGHIAWIVLEHADSLHADAQAFLRRIIETSIGGTRFVLEVRDLAAIAEPLLSRCQLFLAPIALPYEIRAEMQRRRPGLSVESAEKIVAESGGNIRWCVLQALGDGMTQIDESVPHISSVHGWADILAAMEALSRTGSVQRAWIASDASSTGSASHPWERVGGACPWALTANALAKTVTGQASS